MGLFDWLKPRVEPPPPPPAPAPAAPVDLDALAARVRRTTTWLAPVEVSHPLPAGVSKFGGAPWLGRADDGGPAGWPVCPACKVPLTFVAQLFCRDIEALRLPAGHDLIQIWLCEEADCPNVAMGWSFAFWVFCATTGDGEALSAADDDAGGSVTECALVLSTHDELPSYHDLAAPELAALEAAQSDEAIDAAWRPHEGSKVGGHPAFIDDNAHPVCGQCRRPATFLLQIASDERAPPRPAGSPPFEWAPHGLEIGARGTAYFFACLDCPPFAVDTVVQGDAEVAGDG